MTRADDVIAEAREWLGTPWRHQGRLKGEAVDCVGFVVEVARAIGLIDFYEAADYRRRPDGRTLRLSLSRYLTTIKRTEIAPADVLLLASVDTPDHVALVGDYPAGGLSMIHAYLPARRVIEHRLDDSWRLKIVGAYRLPGFA